MRLDGAVLEPADISIWDEGPEEAVPLEFLGHVGDWKHLNKNSSQSEKERTTDKEERT